MISREICFFICSSDNKRAAKWRCNSPNEKLDIYLKNQVLDRRLKISFHASGQCHFAFDRKTVDEQDATFPHKENRFVEKWTKPTDSVPGIKLLARILTPSSAINTSYDPEEERDYIKICPKAKYKTIEVYILHSSPGWKNNEDWPGKNKMETENIGSYELYDHSMIWVVYKTINDIEFPSQKMGNPYIFPGYNEKDILSSINTRMMAFDKKEDDSVLLFDCVPSIQKV